MMDVVPNDEIVRQHRPTELDQFLKAAYRGKWLGAVVALMVILGTILIFRTTEFKFRATITVAPAQQETGLSRNLGGIASLAGVSLARGQPVSPFALYLQMLHSHDIADWVHHDQATMIRLFPNRWDAASRRWHPPMGLVADIARLVKGMVGKDLARDAEPSVADVQTLLNEKLSVVENRRDSLAEISFASADPSFASDFIRSVSHRADELLRIRGLDRADRFGGYLSRQLSIVQVAELRGSLAEALVEQDKQRMIALSGLAFAAEPIGGITLSARASEPKPALMLASGAAAAVGLGLLAAYLRGRSRKVHV
jgi:uncharacterized protein involved in exopolysaccharide biosynthesis